MKLTTLILLALLSCSASAAGKHAYVITKVLLEQSPQAQAANKELQDQFGERQQSLRALAEKIQQMEKTYQNDGAVMSAEQKQKAEDNIISSKRRFQFEQKSLQEDVQSKQRELIKKVRVSIRGVIRAYGEAQGYDFIFTDTSFAYASDAVNITDAIMTELKKQ